MGSEIVEQTAAAVVRDSILGGVALLGIAAAVWAIRVMKQTLDQRVKDADAFAARLEDHSEKDRARAEQVLSMMRDVVNSMRDMQTAFSMQSKAQESVARSIEGITNAVNGILREAIGMRRASGISSDQFRAVKGDKE